MIEADIKNQIVATTQAVLDRAGFSGEVKVVDSGLTSSGALPVVAIESEQDLSMLIGKNGQNLNAFEHLLKVIVFRKFKSEDNYEKNNFVVDINDYRKSRSQQVLTLANTVAHRVISTQKAEALAPMTAYERRLVHTELAGYKELQTESIGEEPHRRIVIKPLSLF